MANPLNAGSQMVEKEISPVSRALRELHSLIEELTMCVEQLGRRVAPGMVPSSPPPATKPMTAVAEPCSEVRMGVLEATRKINSLISEVNDLTSRIEL